MTRANNTDLKDVWQTPDEILSMLGHIDLDPCAGEDTDIGTTNYRYPETNGLAEPWFGSVFVNPAFSKKSEFLQKTIEERDNTRVIYVLTPDSTDTKGWWHKYIAIEADYIWFSEGRISYIVPEAHADEFENYDGGEKAGSPTFGTAISIFGEPPDYVLENLHENGQLLKTFEP